ncbi:MAG TPA: ATP-binding protein [Caulobacteraceae bacterium]|nr:ATP-binding protein [Caulobacteraceae bacterium]
MGEHEKARARINDAGQVLQSILQAQYLRYWLITSWAIALFATIGTTTALLWFAGTLGAGAVRSWFEKRLAAKVDTDYGLIFPAVATLTTCAWAAAPLLAWFSGEPFSQPLALALVICGYTLVFSQLRASPRQAIVISSPYTIAAGVMAATLWGTPAFWPFLALFPFVWSGLFVQTVMTLAASARIDAFQDHQAHLIEELEEARDKADAANRAKSAFLGVISHELRTPMNGVLGAAQLLTSTRLDPTQKEYVAIVRNSGDNLMALLNDILDLTRIEADRLELEAADVDIAEFTARFERTWAGRAREKNVELVVAVDPSAPASVVGDPARTAQIVHNLLSNAVKFTDSGEIRLTVGAERISERRARLLFEVMDTGPGIAPEHLEKLFRPFTQVDGSSTRKFGGAGIGLTLSQKLAQMMGGGLEVASEPGKGSIFTLSLEVDVRAWSAAQVEMPVTADTDEGQPIRVLVVEDHPVNRMIVEAWLASAGHIAVAAENGKIGLEVAGAQAFDLILMDVNMPVMDGLTATRALRASDGPNRDTPVVVLSASARSEDHEAGLEAGADAYLNKPIDFKAFASLLNRLPGGRTGLRQAA